jgi:organic radical activating enzyme
MSIEPNSAAREISEAKVAVEGRYQPKESKFYSCQQLEAGALHFSYDNSLKACFRRDFKDMLELMKYTDEPIDILEAASTIEWIRRLNNESASSPCSGCPQLELKEWDQPQSSYLVNSSIVLNHFTLCNQRCEYCDIWSSKKPMDISKVLKGLFDEGAINPNALIILGGGEPALLKSQLERIIHLSRQNGNPIAISTNSSVYSPYISDFLKTEKRRISQVTTSIDAGTRELYATRHGKDDFDRAIETLKRYQEDKKSGAARVIVKYIVDEQNSTPEQFIPFAEMVAANGFDDIMLNLERELLHGENSAHFRKTRADLKEAILSKSPDVSVELAG